MGDLEFYRVEDPNELNVLWSFEDKNFDKNVQYEKEEWIQWLQKAIYNSKFVAVWFIEKDGELQEYLVAMNAVAPPISFGIYILYYTFKDVKIENTHRMAFEKIKEWAREECQARDIVINTRYPKFMGQFGFVKTEYTSMIYSMDEDWETLDE